MKLKAHSRPGRRNAGWSVWELLVIVFVVAALTLVLIPKWLKSTTGSRHSVCINNLKQISTGLRLVYNGSDSIYPDTIFSRTNSGGSESLWRLFQMAGGDISSPRVLICPADSQKKAAVDFIEESDPKFNVSSFAHPLRRHASLSYFYALGADESSPQRLLMGDRDLTCDPKASDKSPGKVFLTGAQDLGSTTNETKDLRWSTEIHNRFGNVAFMDGSVQQLTSPKLRQAILNSPDRTNRIWLPN